MFVNFSHLLAITADIRNTDENSMVTYTQKKQTRMNFLHREPGQFHMQNGYIFPEVNLRTCCYGRVSFQRQADRLMDPLCRGEVSNLSWKRAGQLC